MTATNHSTDKTFLHVEQAGLLQFECTVFEIFMRAVILWVEPLWSLMVSSETASLPNLHYKYRHSNKPYIQDVHADKSVCSHTHLYTQKRKGDHHKPQVV